MSDEHLTKYPWRWDVSQSWFNLGCPTRTKPPWAEGKNCAVKIPLLGCLRCWPINPALTLFRLGDRCCPEGRLSGTWTIGNITETTWYRRQVHNLEQKSPLFEFSRSFYNLQLTQPRMTSQASPLPKGWCTAVTLIKFSYRIKVDLYFMSY